MKYIFLLILLCTNTLVQAQRFNIVIFDECDPFDETGACYQQSGGLDVFNSSYYIDIAISSYRPNYSYEAMTTLDICGLNKINNRKSKLNAAVECAKKQGLYNPRRINIFMTAPAQIDGTYYIGHFEYKNNAILALHDKYRGLAEYWSNIAVRKLLRQFRKTNPVRQRNGAISHN